MLVRFSLFAMILSIGSVAAQTAQPGWIADARTGCRFWKAVPELDESISWNGACPNGIAQGRGIVQWFKDGKPDGRLEAEFRDGKEIGRGAFTPANGGRYDGAWRDGKMNGRGVYTWANGNRYEVEFRDDKQNGRGVFTSANGDSYDGEWRDGKMNGRGIMTYATGYRYEGEVRDGKQNGRGVLTSANGDHYDGEWRDGKVNGTGTFRNSDRQVFAGIWSNGCLKQGNRTARLGVTKDECGF